AIEACQALLDVASVGRFAEFAIAQDVDADVSLAFDDVARRRGDLVPQARYVFHGAVAVLEHALGQRRRTGQTAAVRCQDATGARACHGTLHFDMAASSNRVRFGINLTGPNRTYAEIVATARVAEAAGFETVAMTDRPPEDNFEAWTLASALGVL